MILRIIKVIVKIILPVVVIGLGAYVANWFINTRPVVARKTVELPAPRVDTLAATKGPQRVKVVGWGNVRAAQSIVLQPEVSGRITDQNSELVPGGRFKAGEMIVNIDPRDYEFAIEQRNAEVTRAESQLTEEDGKQVIAKREWKLLESDMNTTDAGRDLALRKPHLRNAQAALAAAKSGLEAARLDLERTVIRAPFNALVQKELVDTGQLVTPQTQLATLIGTDRFWVQVSIPVHRLAWIKIPGVNGTKASEGSKARVIHAGIEGYEIVRMGRVVRLHGDLDPLARMARVLIAVDDPLGLKPDSPNHGVPLLVGAYVHAEIEGLELPDVVAVPRIALHEGNRVWIANAEDRLEIREIEIAWRRENDVLVESGIQTGERIVTTRIATPIPGMALLVAENGEVRVAEATVDATGDTDSVQGASTQSATQPTH